MSRAIFKICLLLAACVAAVAQGQQLPDELGQAICRINNGDSAGSGTLIGKDARSGLVVTCFHLFTEGVSQVSCHFPSGERFQGNVIATDQTNDLAAIVIAAPRAEPVPLPDYKPVKGEALWSAGFGPNSMLAVNSGTVVKYTDRGDNSWLGFKLTGDARPGDSGGPIFNDKGELAGVLWGAGDGEVAGTGNVLVNTLLMQCPGGACQPRRPRYYTQPAQPPMGPVPPQQPTVPPKQPPVVQAPPCKCDPGAKSCHCDGSGKCTCDLGKVACKCDGKDVAALKVEINKLIQRIAVLEGKPAPAGFTVEIWDGDKFVEKAEIKPGGVLPLERYLIGGK